MMVGIVVVSHSASLAQGVAELAGQMAGPDVAIEVAGGGPEGSLGSDEGLVRDAIRRADSSALLCPGRHAAHPDFAC